MPKLASENGRLIYQAQQILKSTYKEIIKIKEDVVDLLQDYDTTLKFTDEYSYGPKSLYLKLIHTYLFKQDIENIEEVDNCSIKVFGIVVIMDDGGWDGSGYRINRVSLKEEPEIWFLQFEVSNHNVKEKIGTGHISSAFTDSEKENITGELKPDGKVYSYKLGATKKDDIGVEDKKEEFKDSEEEWIGKIIGYPLASITDKAFIKEEILDKLWVTEN